MSLHKTECIPPIAKDVGNEHEPKFEDLDGRILMELGRNKMKQCYSEFLMSLISGESFRNEIYETYFVKNLNPKF